MNTLHLKSFQIGLAGYCLIVIAACSPGTFSTKNNDSLAQNSELSSADNLHPFDVNQFSLNKLVCDPMGSPTNPGVYDGLVAELFYLDPAQPRYNLVADYLEHGQRSDQTLFFSELNIPTRLFDKGFPRETGGVVQDDNGQDLVEYFALRFKSVLKLAEHDEEGLYEMALLSDDGSILSVIHEDGERVTVVNNDVNHPTRMGCGQTLYFDRNTNYDVVLDYFQGPRHHIALIPMWRRVSGNTVAESECGKLGNERYFDYNGDSQPKQPYIDMLARGWRPIESGNWGLPYMAQYNPCHQGQIPSIANFSAVDSGNGSAIITWQTDIPATSQVLIRDSEGLETLTTSDNRLRTNHQVIVSDGITLGIPYSYQAVSISEDLGNSVSVPMDLTLRILSF